MKADKFQDLQPTSCWYSNNVTLKPDRLETQQELMFQLKSGGRKRLMSQLEGPLGGGIPSYLGDGQPFVLVRSSTDQMRPTHTRKGNLVFA